MHPSSQYPEPPQGQGYGYPTPAGQVPPPPVTVFQGDQTLPGTGTTVRVLMFIGGPIGILLGAVLGILLLFVVGGGAALNSVAEAPDEEFGAALGFLGALGAVVALIPLGYGIVSTALAAFMGRRKKGVFWGVVAFNLASALFLLVLVISGDSVSLIPLAVHCLMTILMFTPRVRAHYGL